MTLPRLDGFSTRLLVLFVLTVVAYAACGGNDTTGPGTTTTTTTTTGTVATFAADFTITGAPCTANSTGAVSCTFNGAATGGTPPYTYTSWKFVGPIGGETIVQNQPTARPELGCSFSTGQVMFNIMVTVAAQDSANRSAMTTKTQSITRQPGACGT